MLMRHALVQTKPVFAHMLNESVALPCPRRTEKDAPVEVSVLTCLPCAVFGMCSLQERLSQVREREPCGLSNALLQTRQLPII